MTQFTVAIPTYNGATTLPFLFDRLKDQIKTDHIAWEIIVVDNNSNDDTRRVISDYKTRLENMVPFKYFHEPQQGSAFARIKAMKEAEGSHVALIDDDILPDVDWVYEAWTFCTQHPELGAMSGRILGDFEATPPKNLEEIEIFLSIRNYGDQPQSFNPDKLQLPTTASLVVNKKAWIQSVPDNPTLIGRIGKSMVGGEDYEMLLFLHKNNWKLWYNPKMKSYHRISANRLKHDYLMSLSYACGLPTYFLLTINAKRGERPLIFIRTILGNLKRMAQLVIKYPHECRTDLIRSCQLEFFKGSLLSPFYSLFKLHKF